MDEIFVERESGRGVYDEFLMASLSEWLTRFMYPLAVYCELSGRKRKWQMADEVEFIRLSRGRVHGSFTVVIGRRKVGHGHDVRRMRSTGDNSTSFTDVTMLPQSTSLLVLIRPSTFRSSSYNRNDWIIVLLLPLLMPKRGL